MEVVVYPPDGPEGRSALPRLSQPPRTIEVPAADLGHQIRAYVEALDAELLGATGSGSAFAIDEVELQLTVSAEGRVQLVVGGASAAAAVAITVRLRRRDPA